MDDVPLTDAIKNLARQAGLNYMLDPQINFRRRPDLTACPHRSPLFRCAGKTSRPTRLLNALLNNYNLIIVDDPKTKIARITIKDPAAPDPLATKIIQLKYCQCHQPAVTAASRLCRQAQQGDGRMSAPANWSSWPRTRKWPCDELVARLDTPTKQVLIEAKLSKPPRTPPDQGHRLVGTLQAQHFTFGNNVLGGQSGSPYLRHRTLTRAQRTSESGRHYQHHHLRRK